jgi:Zn-finger nucleic acid-binding protein
MAVVEWRGIEIDHCLPCGGGWLDAGELSLLMTGEPGMLQGPIARESGRSDRRCPACRKPMRRGVLAGVEVDFCSDGCGLWFDRGELAALVGTREAGDRAAPLVRHLREIFGRAAPA